MRSNSLMLELMFVEFFCIKKLFELCFFLRWSWLNLEELQKMLNHGEQMLFQQLHQIYLQRKLFKILFFLGSKQLIQKYLLIIFKTVEHMRIYLLIIVKLFNWLVLEKEFGEQIKPLEELLLFKINFFF